MPRDHSAPAWARREGLWAGSLLACLVVGVAAALGPMDERTWGSPALFLWTAAPAAALCTLGGIAVLVVGARQATAEITLLGGAVTTTALAVLTHALLSHGAGVTESPAVHLSGALVLPLGLLTAAPLVAARARWSRALAASPGAWVLLWIGLTCATCAALLADQQAAWLAWIPNAVWTAVVAAAALAVIGIAHRQLALHRISRRPAALVASAALAEMSIIAVVRLFTSPYSQLWWVLAALEVLASLLLVVAVIAGYRTSGGLRALLAPVVARDPLSAMELGFSPVVHTYVSALEHKDQITRDHVVRVAELAILAGEHLRLPPERLHWLGVGAVLHDIGKLAIPDAILAKPGALSEEEMAVMRTHAQLGGDLVATEPSVAAASWMVRGHHERFDGQGYPDGLSGDELPIEAALISTSDAFDAMAHTRQYRVGLGRERASAVLRELSGSQWHPEAVDAVLAVVPKLTAEPAFQRLGERATADHACYRDWFDGMDESAVLGSG